MPASLSYAPLRTTLQDLSFVYMPWFSCESCGETLKKPKLATHFQRCPAHQLTCLDCNCTFGRPDVQASSAFTTALQVNVLAARSISTC